MSDLIKNIINSLTPEAQAELLAALSKNKRPTLEGHRPAIITDSHRGVAFGYVAEDYATKLKESDVLRVLSLRNIYYWGGTTEGIGQLAATGPGPNPKVGAIIAVADVLDASKVYWCSDKAEAAFAQAGWSR